MDFDLPRLLMYLLSFVLAVTFHEFAHAIVAYRLGDDTPKLQGRLTINPVDHLDPLGTVVLLMTSFFGAPFGWGRPVQCLPSRFKSPRNGMMLVAGAGPLMNLLLAVVVGLVIRFGAGSLPNTSVYFQLLCRFVEVNVLLFLFNLIPVTPLDGSKILAAFLPDNMLRGYDSLMRHWGSLLFIIVLFAASYIIGPMVDHISNAISSTVTLTTALVFPQVNN